MDASTLRTGPSGAALASASKASTEIPGGQRQRRSKNSKETRTVNTNKYKSINYQISLKYSNLSVLSISTKSDCFDSGPLFWSFPRVHPCPMTIGESTCLPTEALMELLTLWPWDGPHGCVVCLGDVSGGFQVARWENMRKYCYILHTYYIDYYCNCSIMSYRDHIYLIIHPSIYFIYSISAGMRHEYGNETGRSLVTSLSSIMSHTMMKWINTNIASLFSGTYRKGTLERLLGGAWTRHYWSIIQYHPDYAKDAPG